MIHLIFPTNTLVFYLFYSMLALIIYDLAFIIIIRYCLIKKYISLFIKYCGGVFCLNGLCFMRHWNSAIGIYVEYLNTWLKTFDALFVFRELDQFPGPTFHRSNVNTVLCSSIIMHTVVRCCCCYCVFFVTSQNWICYLRRWIISFETINHLNLTIAPFYSFFYSATHSSLSKYLSHSFTLPLNISTIIFHLLVLYRVYSLFRNLLLSILLPCAKNSEHHLLTTFPTMVFFVVFRVLCNCSLLRRSPTEYIWS